eukprot:919166-Prymnesium_polylepis.1
MGVWAAVCTCEEAQHTRVRRVDGGRSLKDRKISRKIAKDRAISRNIAQRNIAQYRAGPRQGRTQDPQPQEPSI